MTEAETETARALYDRIRRDSGYGGLSPYGTVLFIAKMMRRDPFVVLHAIGRERVQAEGGDA